MTIARDWDGATYERVSAPMEAMGLEVLDRLELRGDETVLDAGCGSGRVTAALLERLPRGRVDRRRRRAVDDRGGARAARRARDVERARRRPLRARARRARRRDPLDRDLPLDRRPRRGCSAPARGAARRAAGSSPSAAAPATSASSARPARRSPRRRRSPTYLAGWDGPVALRRARGDRGAAARRRLRVGELLARAAAGRARRPARPTTATSSWARTSARLPDELHDAFLDAVFARLDEPARDPLRAAQHRRAWPDGARGVSRGRRRASPSCDLHAVQRRPQPAAAIRLRDGRVPSHRSASSRISANTRWLSSFISISSPIQLLAVERVVVGEANRAPVAVLHTLRPALGRGRELGGVVLAEPAVVVLAAVAGREEVAVARRRVVHGWISSICSLALLAEGDVGLRLRRPRPRSVKPVSVTFFITRNGPTPVRPSRRSPLRGRERRSRAGRAGR